MGEEGPFIMLQIYIILFYSEKGYICIKGNVLQADVQHQIAKVGIGQEDSSGP